MNQESHNSVESLACPACAGSGLRKQQTLTFRKGLELPLFRCADCGHRWIATNAFEQPTIEQKYDETYAGYRIDDFFRESVRDEIRTQLAQVVRQGQRVLDVGCGNGEFLLVAEEMGLVGSGIDVSDRGAQMCCERGLNVIAGDFLTHEWTDQFDLITFWDVMEHLREPAAFLKQAGRVLADDGALILKIPSYGDLNFKLLGYVPSVASALLSAPGHVQFYNRNSLELMLHRSGFTSVKWLKSRKFRKAVRGGGVKTRLKRLLRTRIARQAGNTNLFCIARKSGEF